MSQVLVLAVVALAVLGVVYVVLLILQSSRRAMWPGDSPQYRNHLNMARWIERQLRDDMVNVTIPPADHTEARRLLEQFYGERQLGEGRDE